MRFCLSLLSAAVGVAAFGGAAVGFDSISEINLLGGSCKDWSVSPGGNYNVQMQGTFAIKGNPTGTLAAFVDGELRGLAKNGIIPFGPARGTPFYMMAVNGNSDGDLTFKHCDENGNESDFFELRKFRGGSEGNVLAPTMLDLQASSSPSGNPSGNPCPDWDSLNPAAFVNTATATVMITNDSGAPVETEGRLAAFIDGELRGFRDGLLTRPPFGPYRGVSMYQLTTYGEGRGSLTFKVCKDGELKDLAHDPINWAANGNFGNAVVPFKVILSEEKVTEETFPMLPNGCPDWKSAFDTALYENSMTATVRADSDQNVSREKTGTVAAFINGKLAGVSGPEKASVPPFGPFIGQVQHPIVVFADNDVAGSKPAVKFKWCQDGTVVELTASEDVIFSTNANLGSAIAPVELRP